MRYIHVITIFNELNDRPRDTALEYSRYTLSTDITFNEEGSNTWLDPRSTALCLISAIYGCVS